MTLRLQPDRQITVATANKDKFREIAAVWGDALPPLVLPAAMPHVDERFDSYEENALEKARVLSALVGGPALADDSGIEVFALGGAPGVRSARTPSAQSTAAERNEHLLGLLVGKSDRQARFVCVCALLVPGFEAVIARGECLGMITDRPRGLGGFGYDPIFYSPELGMTFAEAGSERKNVVSHRGNAVRALKQRIIVLA